MRKTRGNSEGDLPASLLNRLEGRRHILARNGYLQLDRNVGPGRYWLLRFAVREGGKRRHRAVYIGSDARCEAVRAWLDRIRGRVPGTPEFEAQQAEALIRDMARSLGVPASFASTLAGVGTNAGRGTGRPPKLKLR